MAKKKTGRRRRARPSTPARHGARDKIQELHEQHGDMDCVYFSHEADTFFGLSISGTDERAHEDSCTFYSELAQLVRGMAEGLIIKVEVADYFLEMQVPGGYIIMSALLISHSDDMGDRMRCPQHVELTGRKEMIKKTPMYFIESKSQPAQAKLKLKFLKFAQQHVQGIDAARLALQAACPAALCVDLFMVTKQTYIFNVKFHCAHYKDKQAMHAALKRVKAVSGFVDVASSPNKLACLRVKCSHHTGKSWTRCRSMLLCMDKGEWLVENLWHLYKAAVAARAAASVAAKAAAVAAVAAAVAAA